MKYGFVVYCTGMSNLKILIHWSIPEMKVNARHNKFNAWYEVNIVWLSNLGSSLIPQVTSEWQWKRKPKSWMVMVFRAWFPRLDPGCFMSRGRHSHSLYLTSPSHVHPVLPPNSPPSHTFINGLTRWLSQHSHHPTTQPPFNSIISWSWNLWPMNLRRGPSSSCQNHDNHVEIYCSAFS